MIPAHSLFNTEEMMKADWNKLEPFHTYKMSKVGTLAQK